MKKFLQVAKGVIENQKLDENNFIEDNQDYPKEILEKKSEIDKPLQAFCDFQENEEYLQNKPSIYKSIVSHIKREFLPDIDKSLLSIIENFEKERIK